MSTVSQIPKRITRSSCPNPCTKLIDLDPNNSNNVRIQLTPELVFGWFIDMAHDFCKSEITGILQVDFMLLYVIFAHMFIDESMLGKAFCDKSVTEKLCKDKKNCLSVFSGPLCKDITVLFPKSEGTGDNYDMGNCEVKEGYNTMEVDDASKKTGTESNTDDDLYRNTNASQSTSTQSNANSDTMIPETTGELDGTLFEHIYRFVWGYPIFEGTIPYDISDCGFLKKNVDMSDLFATRLNGKKEEYTHFINMSINNIEEYGHKYFYQLCVLHGRLFMTMQPESIFMDPVFDFESLYMNSSVLTCDQLDLFSEIGQYGSYQAELPTATVDQNFQDHKGEKLPPQSFFVDHSKVSPTNVPDAKPASEIIICEDATKSIEKKALAIGALVQYALNGAEKTTNLTVCDNIATLYDEATPVIRHTNEFRAVISDVVERMKEDMSIEFMDVMNACRNITVTLKDKNKRPNQTKQVEGTNRPIQHGGIEMDDIGALTDMMSSKHIASGLKTLLEPYTSITSTMDNVKSKFEESLVKHFESLGGLPVELKKDDNSLDFESLLTKMNLKQEDDAKLRGMLVLLSRVLTGDTEDFYKTIGNCKEKCLQAKTLKNVLVQEFIKVCLKRLFVSSISKVQAIGLFVLAFMWSSTATRKAMQTHILEEDTLKQIQDKMNDVVKNLRGESSSSKKPPRNRKPAKGVTVTFKEIVSNITSIDESWDLLENIDTDKTLVETVNKMMCPNVTSVLHQLTDFHQNENLGKTMTVYDLYEMLTHLLIERFENNFLQQQDVLQVCQNDSKKLELVDVSVNFCDDSMKAKTRILCELIYGKDTSFKQLLADMLSPEITTIQNRNLQTYSEQDQNSDEWKKAYATLKYMFVNNTLQEIIDTCNKEKIALYLCGAVMSSSHLSPIIKAEINSNKLESNQLVFPGKLEYLSSYDLSCTTKILTFPLKGCKYTFASHIHEIFSSDTSYTFTKSIYKDIDDDVQNTIDDFLKHKINPKVDIVAEIQVNDHTMEQSKPSVSNIKSDLCKLLLPGTDKCLVDARSEKLPPETTDIIKKFIREKIDASNKKEGGGARPCKKSTNNIPVANGHVKKRVEKKCVYKKNGTKDQKKIEIDAVFSVLFSKTLGDFSQIVCNVRSIKQQQIAGEKTAIWMVTFDVMCALIALYMGANVLFQGQKGGYNDSGFIAYGLGWAKAGFYESDGETSYYKIQNLYASDLDQILVSDEQVISLQALYPQTRRHIDTLDFNSESLQLMITKHGNNTCTKEIKYLADVMNHIDGFDATLRNVYTVMEKFTENVNKQGIPLAIKPQFWTHIEKLRVCPMIIKSYALFYQTLSENQQQKPVYLEWLNAYFNEVKNTIKMLVQIASYTNESNIKSHAKEINDTFDELLSKLSGMQERFSTLNVIDDGNACSVVSDDVESGEIKSDYAPRDCIQENSTDEEMRNAEATPSEVTSSRKIEKNAEPPLGGGASIFSKRRVQQERVKKQQRKLQSFF